MEKILKFDTYEQYLSYDKSIPMVSKVCDISKVYIERKYMVFTYNITNIDTPTVLYNIKPDNIDFMVIDGNTYDLSNQHLFTSIGEYKVKFGINKEFNSLPNNAFNGINSLIDVIIPKEVISIGDSCFSNCGKIKNVTFEDGSELTTIGSSAFYGNFMLEKIIIPKGVSKINTTTFRDCFNLSSVTFEEGTIVSEFGNNAFGLCGFEEFDVPSSVTFMDQYSLCSLGKLKTLRCYGTTRPRIGNRTFEGVAQNGVLYYPNGSDYSAWFGTSTYLLGYYNWTSKTMTKQEDGNWVVDESEIN